MELSPTVSANKVFEAELLVESDFTFLSTGLGVLPSPNILLNSDSD